MTHDRKNISRRKVAAGMAWSVPAVAVASSAPAFALTPICLDAVVGEIDKFPGNSVAGVFQAYGYMVEFTNNTEETIRISGGTFSAEFDKGNNKPSGNLRFFTARPCEGEGAVEITNIEDLLTLEPNETKKIYVVADETGNSANTGGCVDATIEVELVGTPETSGDLCDGLPLPQRCFTETQPAAC